MTVLWVVISDFYRVDGCQVTCQCCCIYVSYVLLLINLTKGLSPLIQLLSPSLFCPRISQWVILRGCTLIGQWVAAMSHCPDYWQQSGDEMYFCLAFSVISVVATASTSQCFPQHCMVKAAALTTTGPRLDYKCIKYIYMLEKIYILSKYFLIIMQEISIKVS